ncbi:CYCLIC NUCLEOTIDE-GATED ION CHANNEL 15-RELATED-RELATED [Salix viminalis]|uniref:CYCLIC NUCLEOTIDE-GATED ION CHANNEL 15-RELATED-RELATED n=1 Tax=Salix viminalis TaxID=40686 RepID=A0A9Q0SE18_SALVM|nr:CYCLIC NUCLEOTIDE-GATED ION CHANNEL 15-RELATED-RELATED [Salix viminalis]
MVICMDMYHSANKGTRISCYQDVFEPWEGCISIQLESNIPFLSIPCSHSAALHSEEEDEAEAEAAEAEGSDGNRRNMSGGGSYSIGATFLATKFAANALRGIHRNRNAKTARELVKLQKPPEPDFTAEDAD